MIRRKNGNKNSVKKRNDKRKQRVSSEYVGENNPGWSDEKIVFVANRAYEICNEFADNNNEYYAIESALEEWEEKND